MCNHFHMCSTLSMHSLATVHPFACTWPCSVACETESSAQSLAVPRKVPGCEPATMATSTTEDVVTQIGTEVSAAAAAASSAAPGFHLWLSSRSDSAAVHVQRLAENLRTVLPGTVIEETYVTRSGVESGVCGPLHLPLLHHRHQPASGLCPPQLVTHIKSTTL